LAYLGQHQQKFFAPADFKIAVLTPGIRELAEERGGGVVEDAVLEPLLTSGLVNQHIAVSINRSGTREACACIPRQNSFLSSSSGYTCVCLL